MTSVHKDTATTLAGNAINTLVVLGTQSCLAWFLGPSGRGEYAACMVLSGLLTLVFGLGIEMGIIHLVGSRRLQLSEAVVAGLWWCVISSVPAVAIGTVLIGLSHPFFENATHSAFLLSLFLVPLNLVTLVFTRALIALGKLTAYSALNVSRSALVLLATVLLLLFTNMKVHGALAALFVGDSLLGFSIYLLLRQNHGFRVAYPTATAMRLLASFAARFYFGKVGRGFNVQLGTLIVGSLGTQSEVGFFATAMAVMSRAWMVPDTVNLVLLPRTASDKRGRPELVARSCRASAIVLLLVILPLVILARPLVIVFFSRAFLPMVPLMWILSLGVIFRGYQRVLASYFTGLGRPGLYSVGILIGLIVNVVSLPLFYGWIGLEGVAWSMTISYAIESIFVGYWFVKTSDQTFGSLWRVTRSDWAKLQPVLAWIRHVGNPPHRENSS